MYMPKRRRRVCIMNPFWRVCPPSTVRYTQYYPTDLPAVLLKEREEKKENSMPAARGISICFSTDLVHSSFSVPRLTFPRHSNILPPTYSPYLCIFLCPHDSYLFPRHLGQDSGQAFHGRGLSLPFSSQQTIDKHGRHACFGDGTACWWKRLGGKRKDQGPGWTVPGLQPSSVTVIPDLDDSYNTLWPCPVREWTDRLRRDFL